MTVSLINHRLESLGLMVRGAFHPVATDNVPGLENGAVGRVVLVGNAGPGMWRAFGEQGGVGAGESDPLNRWIKAAVDALAVSLDGAAIYPFEGPPYYPFQRWAVRAGGVYASPIGPLIHPDYGLWHAYRGAILLPGQDHGEAASEQNHGPPEAGPSPCQTCAGRPCLNTCPVGAFSEAGYDVPACRAHIQTTQGADCLSQGCRARRACPVGRGYVYQPAQAEFHMRAFLGRNYG